MLSLKSLNLSNHYTFCCWYITLCCDLDLWPLTLNICMQRIACDLMKLYQIWTQSSNPRQSYCDYSVWPYNLEHVLSVALGSGIIVTKFDLRQLIRSWITVLCRCWYVMSCCDLDLLPLDHELLRHFGCHAFKLHTKFQRNLIIHGWVIDDLTRFRVQFLRGGSQLTEFSQGCVNPTASNLARTSGYHRLLHFQKRAAQSWVMF